MREHIVEGLKRLEELLDKLPQGAAKEVRQQIEELRELLLEQRPPRFMVVGRRGSGKSSLINAIFGDAVAEVGHVKSQTGIGRWWSYTSELGAIDILDTRGFQEGSAPEQHDVADDAIGSILNAVEEKLLDVIVFLIKAKEADAAIDADLAALLEVYEAIGKRSHYYPPIMAVITHCDEVEPKNVRLHEPDDEDPEDIEEKRSRIRIIERHVEDKLREHVLLKEHLIHVLGVCSYMSWRKDGTIRADERWRIGELLDFLLHELPNEARVEFARLSQVLQLQTSIARTITQLVAKICAGIAAVPVPVADIVPITSLQTSLVAGIAYIAGRTASAKTAGEFLASAGINVGAAFVFREVARGLGKFLFPAAGSLVSAAVAYGATVGIGETAIAYFLRELPDDNLKIVYQEAKQLAEENYKEDPNTPSETT